jgi:hypothetical protein
MASKRVANKSFWAIMGFFFGPFAIPFLFFAQKESITQEESITLYHLEREDIKINIVARFEKDKLIIDGYDIGKTVKEAWGDSDYEYVMTIPAKSLPPLYGLLGVEVGDRRALLKALARRFHGNKCFSAIGDFLDQNSIEHKTFTWT